MQKEIFEQPESVVNTMRGRVNFENNTGEASCAQISESFPTRHKASREFIVVVNLDLLLHWSEDIDLTGTMGVFANIYQLTKYVLTSVELNGQSTASL